MNTETHYLQHELHELNQKDLSILEFIQLGSLDGIWYWDLESPENEWMSSRFWEILGFNPTEKEHLAKEWQDIINPEDLQVALRNFEKHCDDPNYPYDQVVRYRHKKGSTVWIRCRGMAIRNSTGKPVRMLGAHTDLTQLKRTEEELKKKTIELESTNNELQNALANIKTLHGLLSICAECNKVRDDKEYLIKLETYIKGHTDTKFTHCLCVECEEKLYGDQKWYKKKKKK